MTRKQGDRRGLNPRQLEPQSYGNRGVLHTYVNRAVARSPSGPASNHASRTGPGLATVAP